MGWAMLGSRWMAGTSWGDVVQDQIRSYQTSSNINMSIIVLRPCNEWAHEWAGLRISLDGWQGLAEEMQLYQCRKPALKCSKYFQKVPSDGAKILEGHDGTDCW